LLAQSANFTATIFEEILGDAASQTIVMTLMLIVSLMCSALRSLLTPRPTAGTHRDRRTSTRSSRELLRVEPSPFDPDVVRFRTLHGGRRRSVLVFLIYPSSIIIDLRSDMGRNPLMRRAANGAQTIKADIDFSRSPRALGEGAARWDPAAPTNT
jgi:hypothetical protein